MSFEPKQTFSCNFNLQSSYISTENLFNPSKWKDSKSWITVLIHLRIIQGYPSCQRVVYFRDEAAIVTSKATHQSQSICIICVNILTITAIAASPPKKQNKNPLGSKVIQGKLRKSTTPVKKPVARQTTESLWNLGRRGFKHLRRKITKIVSNFLLQ